VWKGEKTSSKQVSYTYASDELEMTGGERGGQAGGASAWFGDAACGLRFKRPTS